MVPTLRGSYTLNVQVLPKKIALKNIFWGFPLAFPLYSYEADIVHCFKIVRRSDLLEFSRRLVLAFHGSLGTASWR